METFTVRGRPVAIRAPRPRSWRMKLKGREGSSSFRRPWTAAGFSIRLVIIVRWGVDANAGAGSSDTVAICKPT